MIRQAVYGSERWDSGRPKGAGTLYTVVPDGTVETKLEKVTISNGIVWSANKKYMYYNDTPTGKVARYRYDEKDRRNPV